MKLCPQQYSPQESKALHERFIEQCFLHLDDLMDDTGAAPKTSTGKVSDLELKLQAIERLLLLAQRYITVVEVSSAFYNLKAAGCLC